MSSANPELHCSLPSQLNRSFWKYTTDILFSLRNMTVKKGKTLIDSEAAHYNRVEHSSKAVAPSKFSQTILTIHPQPDGKPKASKQFIVHEPPKPPASPPYKSKYINSPGGPPRIPPRMTGSEVANDSNSPQFDPVGDMFNTPASKSSKARYNSNMKTTKFDADEAIHPRIENLQKTPQGPAGTPITPVVLRRPKPRNSKKLSGEDDDDDLDESSNSNDDDDDDLEEKSKSNGDNDELVLESSMIAKDNQDDDDSGSIREQEQDQEQDQDQEQEQDQDKEQEQDQDMMKVDKMKYVSILQGDKENEIEVPSNFTTPDQEKAMQRKRDLENEIKRLQEEYEKANKDLEAEKAKKDALYKIELEKQKRERQEKDNEFKRMLENSITIVIQNQYRDELSKQVPFSIVQFNNVSYETRIVSDKICVFDVEGHGTIGYYIDHTEVESESRHHQVFQLIEDEESETAPYLKEKSVGVCEILNKTLKKNMYESYMNSKQYTSKVFQEFYEKLLQHTIDYRHEVAGYIMSENSRPTKKMKHH